MIHLSFPVPVFVNKHTQILTTQTCSLSPKAKRLICAAYSLLFYANCKFIIHYLNSKWDKFPFIFFSSTPSLWILWGIIQVFWIMFFFNVFVCDSRSFKNNEKVKNIQILMNFFLRTNKSIIFWYMNIEQDLPR